MKLKQRKFWQPRCTPDCKYLTVNDLKQWNGKRRISPKCVGHLKKYCMTISSNHKLVFWSCASEGRRTDEPSYCINPHYGH